MTAQQLYDWRDETGAISGTDLHMLFQELIGDPSPAGNTPILMADLAQLAEGGDMDAEAALFGMLFK